MNLKGEPAYVGRHCGSHVYEVTPEVVAFYADALDDPNPIYERFAPPLLHHSECYTVLGEWYLKNLFGNLHAQQDWELFAPIPLGARIRTVSTIVDRYDKRGRNYVVNETDVFDDATHELLVRGRTYQSFLPPKREGEGEGYVVDEKSAKKKEPRPPFPTATGRDLASTTKVVDQRRCWMFSGPGKNYHTDAEAAKQLGFPNIVVQGMMSTCFVSEIMLREFGEGWLRGGKSSLKLTNVLWVDETVSTFGKVREERPEGTQTRVVCEVWCEKPDGTRILIGEASALR
ncbi:MAG TPA: MaoC family dehydratase [Myxococcota bacterium]|nr:MaoC family dehydratase [Myxococcota bacterium]